MSIALNYQQSTRISSAGKSEKVVTILFLVYFSDVLDAFGPLETAFATASYLILPYLIIRHWKRFLYFSVKDIPLLLLVGMAVASLQWSYVMGDTLVTVRALIRITLFAVYFAMRYSLREQLYLVAWTYGIAAVISLVVGPILPGGLENGDWRGSFPHKNNAARAMTLASVTFLCIAFKSQRYKQIKWAGSILSIVHLLLTRGKTGLVIFIITLSMWSIRKVFKQYYLVRIPLLVLALFICTTNTIWVSNNYELIIVNYLGKDLSLTGRTQLWEVLIERIYERPWIGYGYYGFWSSDRGQLSLLKEVQYGWVPTHAHNGFIDLTLMLGTLGLMLFFTSFITTFVRSIQFATVGKTPESYWSLLCLVVMFLFNITETITILSPTEMTWILYTSASLSLASPRDWVQIRNERAVLSSHLVTSPRI